MVLSELAPQPVYGPAAHFFEYAQGTRTVPEECLLEGTAGSAKTHNLCQAVLMWCAKWPDSKGLMIRTTRKELTQTTLPILEKIMGPQHPMLRSGGRASHRESYKAPGMGEIVLGGMDDPYKHYGSEYDWIWFSEVQGFNSKEGWESLHRACRRTGMPFNILFADANPSDPAHFINQRCNEGRCERLVARLYHNPIAYDWERGEWLEWGLRYARRCARNMTGVTLKRLFLGEWCAAEGAVLDNWDPAKHTLTGRLDRDVQGRFWLYVPERGKDWKVEIVRMVGGQDFGWTNPGVAQVWGIDREGRIYMLGEVYRTKRNPAWWARTWAKLYRRFPLLEAGVADHSPGEIDLINAELVKVQQEMGVADPMPAMFRPWSKHRGPDGEKAGVGACRARLEARGDGSRGLYVLTGNLLGPRDEALYHAGKPWNTLMEIPGVVYEQTEDGKPNKERILKVNDHGFDVMRGVCTYLERRAGKDPIPASVLPPGSFNALIPGFEDEWLKDGMAEGPY